MKDRELNYATDEEVREAYDEAIKEVEEEVLKDIEADPKFLDWKRRRAATKTPEEIKAIDEEIFEASERSELEIARDLDKISQGKFFN